MSVLREKGHVLDHIVRIRAELDSMPDQVLETEFELQLRELRAHEAPEYRGFASWYGEYLLRTYKVR